MLVSLPRESTDAADPAKTLLLQTVAYSSHAARHVQWPLVAGFLVLAQSAFELNSGMGLLTAITIALALFIDFLFLPPLLIKFEEKADESVDADSAGAATVHS